ncbi:MAG: hypothetical protein KZY61_07465 [Clostridiaceae bacterium]|nr:hypothetical protein [Clostridiaceae bacterium]MBW4860569.1 hypothetical protein [Clostridiaceae bacterium]MBW4868485.1 hypothetical protein [Clostridiaceae bacterium]
MYIGIKYCGGCNSRYDRVKLVNDIKNCFKDYEFNYANGNESFDLILVINGCHISCASLEGFKSRKGFLNITDNDIKEIAWQISKKLN